MYYTKNRDKLGSSQPNLDNYAEGLYGNESMLRLETQPQASKEEELHRRIESEICESASRLEVHGNNLFRLRAMEFPISGWVYAESKDLLFLKTPLKYPNGEEIKIFVNGFKIDPDAKLDRFGNIEVKFTENMDRIVRSPYEIDFLSGITEEMKEKGSKEVIRRIGPFIKLNLRMLDEEGRLRSGWEKEQGYPFSLSIYKKRNFE